MSWRTAAVAAAMVVVVSPTLASASSVPGAGTPRWNPGLEWPLARLQADALWRQTLGAGVTIAIVDTGIDTTRPDLIGAVIGTANLTKGPATDVSDDSHGTAVAGLIAGRGRSLMAGLAPQVSLIDIKVAAQPDKATPGEIAVGIRKAAELGAEIINVSIGTRYDDETLRRAVAFAEQRCLIVASAGDTGTPQYPAGDPGVVSVAAIDAEGTPVPRPGPGSGTPVSLYAPGADLFSTAESGSADGGYMYDIDGSGYATAYVSAAAALLLAADTPLSPRQAGQLLVSTALPMVGTPGARALYPVAALPRLTLPSALASPKARTKHAPVDHSGLPGLLAIVIIVLAVLGLTVTIWVIKSRPSASVRWPPPGQVPGQQPLEPSSWSQTW
jgi:subtilisin family serine protease